MKLLTAKVKSKGTKEEARSISFQIVGVPANDNISFKLAISQYHIFLTRGSAEDQKAPLNLFAPMSCYEFSKNYSAFQCSAFFVIHMPSGRIEGSSRASILMMTRSGDMYSVLYRHN